jgi:hypothetical protein
MTILQLITDEDCITMFARRFADIILARADAHTLELVQTYAQTTYTPRRFVHYMTAVLPLITVSAWTNAVMDLEQHYLVEGAREKLANRVAALVVKGYEYGYRGPTEQLLWLGEDVADDDMLDLRDLDNGGTD